MTHSNRWVRMMVGLGVVIGGVLATTSTHAQPPTSTLIRWYDNVGRSSIRATPFA